jgi:hypothetical protein
MRVPLVLLLPGLLLVGCVEVDPLFCDENTPCTDPARPFCDLEGVFPASEGRGKTCIADPTGDAGPQEPGVDASFCTPGAFVQCSDGDTALYCNEAGSELVSLDCDAGCSAAEGGCFCEPNSSICRNDTTLSCDASGQARVRDCALGCNDTGERCVDVNPSNGLAGFLDMTEDAPVVVLTSGATINTDTGTIKDGDGSTVTVPSFQVTAPTGGVAIRVFAVKSLHVGDAQVSGLRALAIVSDGDVVVGGHLRVASGKFDEGSCIGGNSICVTFVPGGFAGLCGGGGGGGFGTAGGKGGTASGSNKTATGGSAGTTGGSAALVPLRGGCRGGGINMQGPGMPAGGAIQLVSRTRVALESGASAPFVDVNGSGGSAGAGSGGGILLEAPRVVVPSGTGLVANGGGGGCQEFPGEPGRLSTSPAKGGACSGSPHGRGGDGGAIFATAGDGQSIAPTTQGNIFVAGSAGGGVGRVRINVPTATDFVKFGTVSPAPSIGTLATR